MMSYQDCLNDYRAWRERHGVSNCDAVIRSENRRRVNSERDKRDKTSKAEKQKMFNDQKGICPIESTAQQSKETGQTYEKIIGPGYNKP
jgi:hypothetical protein